MYCSADQHPGLPTMFHAHTWYVPAGIAGVMALIWVRLV